MTRAGDFRRRSRLGQRPLQTGTEHQSVGAAGPNLVWPLHGFRPTIPFEDWRPNAQLGLAWGAEFETENWDIVVLARASNGSLWAAEYGGKGSNLCTDSTEPDWSDTPPITDGDYLWYPVVGTSVQVWSPGMTIDGPTFIAAEGYTWVSFPGYTGTTGGSEPDWAAALGTNPLTDADYVADGDTYWWPLPLAEETLTGDPAYGHWLVKVLPGHDGIRVTDGTAPADDGIVTSITGTWGLRFDQYFESTFLYPGNVGTPGLRVVAGSGYINGCEDTGEADHPDDLGNYTDINIGDVVLARVIDATLTDGRLMMDPIGKALRLVGNGVAIAIDGDPTGGPSPVNASLQSTWRAHIDEGADELVFTVVYANGTTVKTGSIALT